MNFIIVSLSVQINPVRGGYYIARSYMGDFMARDYIAPVYKDYFGKLGCSQALCFETLEKARDYINNNGGLIPNDWKIAKYNAFTNTIMEVLQ